MVDEMLVADVGGLFIIFRDEMRSWSKDGRERRGVCKNLPVYQECCLLISWGGRDVETG
jgi:hypothetical protein